MTTLKTLAAPTMLIVAPLTSFGSAAVTATVIVDSPTALTLGLDGSLEGSVLERFQTEISIDFGTMNYTDNIDPTITSGGYIASSEGPIRGTDGALYNNPNTAFDSIDLFDSRFPGYSVGTMIYGEASFEYATPHLIEVGQPFSVR